MARVRRGETLAIIDGGHVVARLGPASDPIAEHSMVRLLAALPSAGLNMGAVGTVVHVYEGDEDYEVEFICEGKPKLVTVPGVKLEVAEPS